MKDARYEPYWGLFKGEPARYSELNPTTAHLVDIFVAEGKAVRQYLLPFDNKQESTVWLTEKVNEKKAYETKRLEQVRTELKTYIRI